SLRMRRRKLNVRWLHEDDGRSEERPDKGDDPADEGPAEKEVKAEQRRLIVMAPVVSDDPRKEVGRHQKQRDTHAISSVVSLRGHCWWRAARGGYAVRRIRARNHPTRIGMRSP